MRMCCWITVTVVVSLHVTSAMGATIKMRTGAALSGDIFGWVVLKREVTEPDKGFAYLRSMTATVLVKSGDGRDLTGQVTPEGVVTIDRTPWEQR